MGFDEVGMGCLAGPVVAAGFAYPLSNDWLSRAVECVVNDSKKMSEKQRLEAEAWLCASGAHFTVSEVSPEEIDELNILRASQKAMWLSFAKLQQAIAATLTPQCTVALLVDGNRLAPDFARLKSPWFAQTIVKGDSKSFPIAAASILAKNHRDHLMTELAAEHPQYGWASNVGYPTVEHKIAIRDHGPTIHHRRSFNWILHDSASP